MESSAQRFVTALADEEIVPFLQSSLGLALAHLAGRSFWIATIAVVAFLFLGMPSIIMPAKISFSCHILPLSWLAQLYHLLRDE